MKAKKRTRSFRTQLTNYLLIMLLLESVLFVAFLFWGNILSQFDKNASDVFVEEVSNRASYLKTDMIQRWSQLDWTQSVVQETVKGYLKEHHITTDDLLPGKPDTIALLKELAPDLISTLRRNSVNGVFIVFDGSENNATQEEDGVSKAGLCLRDADPTTASDSNADVQLKYGSYKLANQLGLAMDINWSPTITVNQDSEWYYSSLSAVASAPYAAPNQLGYWAPIHTISNDQSPRVITYTEPLVTKSGKPYGVIGIEITEDYLRAQLPYSELPGEKKDSAYVLAYTTDDEEELHIMGDAGALATWIFGTESTFRIEPSPKREPLYQVIPMENIPEDLVYSYLDELTLYDQNSHFSREHWYLVAITLAEDLFAHTVQIQRRGEILLLIAILLGAAIALLAGLYFSRPLKKLSTALRKQDPNKPVVLKPTNIQEVDDLSNTIMALSEEMTESLSRTNQIIDRMNMPIAVFQFNAVRGRLSCSSRFFSILGLPDPEEPLTEEKFTTLLETLNEHIEEDLGDGETVILRLADHRNRGETRWVQFQQLHSGDYMMGTLVDITESRVELARIEFERDHDALTGLSNRLAFNNHVAEVAKRPKPGICAVMMMDMDNLKSVNDTYGHDYGDEYIRAAANILRRFASEHCFPARISGDEFYIFFSGYKTRQKVEGIISRIRNELMKSKIRLPQGEVRRLRASAGVAWYPDDTDQVENLVRYADFAMYQAKHSEKGSLCAFDATSYHRNSVLVYDDAELDRIIETAAVDFVFQPIVSCADGSVLGYEGLIRPRSTVFPTPLEFLQIARMQSKLHYVEVLTWMEGSAAFLALKGKAENARLFLNSFPSQNLTKEELAEYNRRFPGLMGRMVLELLESDENNNEHTAAKLLHSKEDGMMIALDDFGSGYSNESLLLNLRPHFVKVDRDVIQEINTDSDRQTVFRNIVESCHSMGIQIVAEGVETSEQLRTVASLGADYVQGYYISRPAPQLKPIPENVREELKAIRKERRAG